MMAQQSISSKTRHAETPVLLKPGGLVERLLSWVGRNRHMVFAIVGIVHILAFNGRWRVTADASNYLWTGRALYESGSFTWFWHDPIPYHPGLAWIIAGCFYMFGSDAMWAVMLVISGSGLLALCFLYLAAKPIVGRGVATAALLMVGLNARFLEYSVLVLADVPFLCGFMLLLLSATIWRDAGRSWLRISVAIGLALLGLLAMAALRSVVFTVIAGCLAVVPLRLVCARGIRWPWKFAVLAAGVIAFLAFLAIVRMVPTVRGLSPDLDYATSRLIDVSGFAQRLFPDAIVKYLNVEMPYAIFGIELQWIGAVLVSAMIVSTLLLLRRSTLWVALTWAFLVQILFFVIVKRYFLPIVPILAIAWVLAAAWVETKIVSRWGSALAAFMLAVWMVPNLVEVSSLIVSQRSVPFYQHYKSGRYETIFADSHKLASLPRGVLILSGFDDDGTLGYFARGGSIHAAMNDRQWHGEFKPAAARVDELLLAYPDRLALSSYVALCEIEREGRPLVELGDVPEESPEGWIRIYRAFLPAYSESDFDVLASGLLRMDAAEVDRDDLRASMAERSRFRPEVAVMLFGDEYYEAGPGFLIALHRLAGERLAVSELDALVNKLREGTLDPVGLAEALLTAEAIDDAFDSVREEVRQGLTVTEQTRLALSAAEADSSRRIEAVVSFLRRDALDLFRPDASPVRLASVVLWLEKRWPDESEWTRWLSEVRTTKQLAVEVSDLLRRHEWHHAPQTRLDRYAGLDPERAERGTAD